MSGLKQRELLGALGFPATDKCSCILSRIIPEPVRVDAMVRLKDALKIEEVAKLLSQLPRVNAGALALAGNPRFLNHITPNLLSEIEGSEEEEDNRAGAGVLLQDLQRVWSVLDPYRSAHRFQSVSSLRRAHQETSLEYCARLPEEAIN